MWAECSVCVCMCVLLWTCVCLTLAVPLLLNSWSTLSIPQNGLPGIRKETESRRGQTPDAICRVAQSDQRFQHRTTQNYLCHYHDITMHKPITVTPTLHYAVSCVHGRCKESNNARYLRCIADGIYITMPHAHK